MIKKQSVPIEVLRGILHLDAEKGELFWLPRARHLFPNNGTWISWNLGYGNRPAFRTKDKAGYLVGSIFNIHFKAHRVVWALYYGEWPADNLDHINRIKHDNRIQNLRMAGHSVNSKNMCISKNNSSGVLGVFWNKSNRKWRVQICANRKTISLGYFSDKDKAIACRKAAEIEHGFHPNHGMPL